MRRALFWSALSLVTVTTGLYFWLRSPSGKRVILSHGVKLAEKRIEGNLSVGRLEGGLFRDLVLHDVRIVDREGQPAIEIAELHAEYELRPLLRSELHLRSLELKGARIRARRLANGQINLLALLPGDGSSLTVRIDSLRLDGEARFESIHGQLHAEAATTFGGGRMDAQLRTLRFQGPTTTLTGRGDLSQGIDFDLSHQDLHAHARVRLTPEGRLAWRARADGDLDPAELDPRAPPGRLHLSASGHGEDREGTLELKQLSLVSGEKELHAFGRVVHHGQAWELTLEELRLGGHELHVNAQLRGHQVTLHLAADQLAVGESKLNALRVTATGDYRKNLHVEAQLDGAPLFRARASLAGRDALSVDGEIPDFDLGRLGLSGTVDGNFTVRGTLRQPLGHAALRAQNVAFHEQRLARVDLDATWDGQVLDATVDADRLRLSAHLPADAEAPLSLALTAHAFPVAVTRLGPLRQLRGTLDADLRVAGPRAQAGLSGTLALANGSVGIAGDARQYHDLTVDVAAHEGRIELRRLALQGGEGSLTAEGHALVEGPRLESIDLTFQAAQFPVMAGNLGAWIDATAELHGERAGDRLTGTLTITHGGARLPELTTGRGRQLQPLGRLEDVHFSDEPQQRARPRLDAEVVAHLPGPFKLRSRELEADVRGQLDVLLTDGKLRLEGHGETTWGRIELFGHRYEIERARVDFDGSPDPNVDVRLTRQITGTTIVVEVQGTAKNPRLLLASDPPIYDSTQILGILLSGDPGYPGLPDNRRGVAQKDTVASAVSNLFVSKISEQLLPGLPLAVRVEAGRAARIELGHQLTDRIYLRYTHHFGATGSGLHQVNANEATVQVRFRRRASLTLRYGDAGVGVLDVSWMLRF
jgi:autotransporter translocation and assembly factor TamB